MRAVYPASRITFPAALSTSLHFTPGPRASIAASWDSTITWKYFSILGVGSPTIMVLSSSLP